VLGIGTSAIGSSNTHREDGHSSEACYLPDMRRRNVGMRVLPRRGLVCVVWLGYAFDEPTLTWCGPGAIVDTAEATRDAPVGQYELLGGRVGPTGGSACP
jgi:hypothetical protein